MCACVCVCACVRVLSLNGGYVCVCVCVCVCVVSQSGAEREEVKCLIHRSVYLQSSLMHIVLVLFAKAIIHQTDSNVILCNENLISCLYSPVRS